MTVDDLTEIEHAYAPPSHRPRTPSIWPDSRRRTSRRACQSTTWNYLLEADIIAAFLLDVRTPAEFATGTILAQSTFLDSLRERIAEIPRDKTVIIFCRVGLIAYNAARVLEANGIIDYFNLSGGYETWHIATATQESTAETIPTKVIDERNDTVMQVAKENSSKIVEVNACGLQCPGPVMRLKRKWTTLRPVKDLDHGKRSRILQRCGFLGESDRQHRPRHQRRKGIVKAVIEKGGAAPTPRTSAGNDKTLIVFSGDLDKAIASFIIANGALAAWAAR
jgi:rhodanese-related sulfurtransferase